MALSKKPYRGTRDFFPTEKRILNYMFSVMNKTASSFGYESYDGPLLEEVELYKAKSGEELINEQIYSFTDRGERFVAIRPEMTPTLARMIASCHREEPKPIRWFSIPNLMRYEKPQKGRLREHWQFNCDIFGAPGRSGEVEVLEMVIELLENFGANDSHFEVLINDRLIVDTVFNNILKVNEEESYKLYKIVDKAKKVKQDAIEKMVNETSLDSTQKENFYAYLDCKTFQDATNLLEKHNFNDEASNLKSLIDQFTSLGLAKYLTFDPTIVRGLDYYTGIVFEVFDKHPDNRRAICGGGAYANLLKIFNEEPVPGVGFGLGDVTLKDFLIVHGLLPNLEKPCFDIYLTTQFDDGMNDILILAKSLRKEGFTVLTHPSALKFKKVFSGAEKKGISCALMYGENESQAGEVQLKNLSSKEQSNIKIDNITDIKKFIVNCKA
jgi:histidyl-tRNA synthetase